MEKFLVSIFIAGFGYLGGGCFSAAGDVQNSVEGVGLSTTRQLQDSIDITPLISRPDLSQASTERRIISGVRKVDLGSGEPAPDFELKLFNGENVRMSDFKGQIVVLNFWASWCGPCRWEMPSFEAVWQEYRNKDVVFIGVAMSDFEKTAREFSEEVGVTYPLGLDMSGKIGEAYGVSVGGVISVPTTFIVDREGNQARRFGVANEAVLRIFLKGHVVSD